MNPAPSWLERHTVNLAEVVRKMIANGMPAAETQSLVEDLHLAIVDELTEQQAYAVGCLAAENQALGLSLRDCVCLATAEWHGTTAVTADRRWSELKNTPGQVLQIRDQPSTARES